MNATAPNPVERGAPRHALVTGGAGFIGSHLVEALLARGDRVTVIDDFSTGRTENLGSLHDHPSLRLIRGTVSETLAPSSAPHQNVFDEIYHLAAAVGVQRVIERPFESIETNVQETAAVLRFAAAQRGPSGETPRVLIASSSEVYGKSAKAPFSEDDDCLYGPTTALRWSYACTKAIDEYLALAQHARTGLPVVIVRFFNTIGPRQVGDYGMVVPRFIRAVLDGRAPEVYGDGKQSRCFCDVRDSVPALLKLLATPSAAGRVFNLGSDTPITIAALAEMVIATLGSTVAPRFVPYDEAYSPGFEDLRQRKPDLTRVREAIAFDPRITLAQTISDIANEMRHTRGGASSSAGAIVQPSSRKPGGVGSK